jgi:uncharacterized membrane protein (UPF0127 family)
MRFSSVLNLSLCALGLALMGGAWALFAAPAHAIPDSRSPQVCVQVERDLKAHPPATQPLDVVSRHATHRFNVEIAADDASRELGLMCRKTMAPSHGMLFEFALPEQQIFWMKNTYLPLDIIYIGHDGRIVSIAADAKPFDETPLPSRGAADGVLEIKGGLAAKLGIRPGDQVRHPFYTRR